MFRLRASINSAKEVEVEEEQGEEGEEEKEEEEEEEEVGEKKEEQGWSRTKGRGLFGANGC